MGTTYKNEFDERDYTAMLERDCHGKRFVEIGQKLGISTPRAKQIYERAKRKQLSLYLKVIAEAEGTPSHDLRERAVSLSNRFGSNIYAIAYLEKTYQNILDAYRGSEPGSGYVVPEISAINQEYYEQPSFKTVWESDITDADLRSHVKVNESTYINISLYRIELNVLESAVLNKYEKEKHSLERIAHELGITHDMAIIVHRKARDVLLYKKIVIISEKTGKSFCEIKNEACNAASDFSKWKQKTDYLETAYREVLFNF